MKVKIKFILALAGALNFAYGQNPCWPDSSIMIVVLGSSTAAGIGASNEDSSWVGRYRNYLQSINPTNEVVNLAISGTTTYHIMPDGYVPPSGTFDPVPGYNITEAIRLQADAIIVNMPSNDASRGYDAAVQMHNFKTIAHEADSAGVPIWICTTQPRDLSTSKIQIQLEVRDSILSYFGTHAIDFWTTIADTNNLPNPLYDFGDGIHLNDAGHRILFDRIAQKNIPAQIMDSCVTVGIAYGIPAIRIYPNPARDELFISNVARPSDFQLYNLLGCPVYYAQISPGTSGIKLYNLPAGTYIYQLANLAGLISIAKD